MADSSITSLRAKGEKGGSFFFIGNTFHLVVRCVLIMSVGNRNRQPVLWVPCDVKGNQRKTGWQMEMASDRKI